MVTPIFLNDQFNADDIAQILDTNAKVQYFKYVVLIYCSLEEIQVGNVEMDLMISREKKGTVLICLLTLLLTISFVVIFTFNVSVSFSRPLRKLVNHVSTIVTTNTQQKALMLKALSELKNLEKITQF